MILLDKIYDGESIVDSGRDIYEAINIYEHEIPVDEYNFPLGEIKITIEWCESFEETK
jgi:hypothetical protein